MMTEINDTLFVAQRIVNNRLNISIANVLRSCLNMKYIQNKNVVTQTLDRYELSK